MLNDKKRKLLLLSIVVILSIAAGITSAFLSQITSEVPNTFQPSSVTCEITETFQDNIKTNVAVKNTGDIDAYIRAGVVVTWQDEKGNVYGKMPVEGTDYTIEYDLANGWVYNEADEYYYYTKKVTSVEPNNVTGVLISEAKLAEGAQAPAGYYLSVEILASAVQADGVSDGEGEPGSIVDEPAVLNAWGINPTQLGNN